MDDQKDNSMIYKNLDRDWLCTDLTLDEEAISLIYTALENTYSHKEAKSGSFLLLKRFKKLRKEFSEYQQPDVEMFIWEFNEDCGRHGNLHGSFVASEAYVKSILGLKVYYYEYLGKHSEVSWELHEGNFDKRLGCHEGDVASFLKVYPTGNGVTPGDGMEGDDILDTWIYNQGASGTIQVKIKDLGVELYTDGPYTAFGGETLHKGQYGNVTLRDTWYLVSDDFVLFENPEDLVDVIDAREFFRYFRG